ncbi:GFA family protein [Shimia sp. W99]
MDQIIRRARCRCGKVVCEAVGPPILTAVCYCGDCQAGGRMIEARNGAGPVLEADGGAAYLTYRDDRFRCVAGAELLQGIKLRDKAPTQRFVATCCNSAMYLKFKPGHWVSTYRNRFEEGALPPVEMRTNIRKRQSDLPLPQDAPAYRRFPMRLFGRLIKARLDMALGR